MKLTLSEIDDLYLWIDNNKIWIKQASSFEEVARAAADKIYRESSPSKYLLEEIISYLKKYTPNSVVIKCYACKGSKGFYCYLGVKPGAKPNYTTCAYCNGSGLHLHGDRRDHLK